MLRRLVTAVALFFMLGTASASADTRSLNAAAEAQLEALANGILGRNIASESFQVSADIELDEAKIPRLPLNPGSSREAMLRALSPSAISAIATKIQIEISVDSTINAAVQKSLGKILTKKLFLENARGDAVKFVSLNLPTPSSRLRDELAKSTSELSSLKTKNDLLERSLKDLERSLADSKSEHQKTLAETKAEQQKALDKQNQKDGSDGSSELNRWAPLFLPISFVVSALLAALGLLVALPKASKTVSQSVGAVAESLSKVASNGSFGGSSLTQGGIAPPPTKSETPVLADARSPRESSRELKSRLFELHDEIVAVYEESTRNFVLEHVTKILRSDEASSSAVLLMEFLGQERANELFHLLDAESRSKVLAYMQNREPEPNKLGLMIALGEELKTLLILNGMKASQDNKDSALAVEIAQLSETTIVAALEQLNESGAGRLMSYLPPKDLAKYLSLVQREKFDQVLAALVNLPDHAEKKGEDAQILDILVQVKAGRDANLVRYYSYFKALVESTDDELSELIKERLPQADLKAYLSENAVSYSLLFELDAEALAAVLSPLGLRELALILRKAQARDADRILAALSTKKKELVQEEAVFVAELSESAFEQSFKPIKDRILAELRARQRSGQLTKRIPRPNLKIA